MKTSLSESRKWKSGFFLIGILLANSALAKFETRNPQQAMDELLKMLPARAVPYQGKNNGRACTVDVKHNKRENWYSVVVKQDPKKESGKETVMAFILKGDSKVQTAVFDPMDPLIQASVDVVSGNLVTWKELYGSDYELNSGVEIRIPTRISNQKARKIWVTNRKAGSIGASGPACIILLD